MKQDDDSDSPIICCDKLRSCCEMLQQVEIDLPDHHRIKVQDYTFRIVRWWTIVMFLASAFASFFASDLSLAKTPVHYILGYVLYGMIVLCLALSFYLDSKNFSVAAAYIYQVRILMNLTVPVNYDDPGTRFKNMFNLIQVTIVAFFNAFLFTQVNPWRRSLQYFINVVIQSILICVKLLGFDDISKHLSQVIFSLIPVGIFWLIFSAVSNSISNFTL